MTSAIIGSKRSILVPTKKNIEFGEDAGVSNKTKKKSFSVNVESTSVNQAPNFEDIQSSDIPENVVEKFLQNLANTDSSNGNGLDSVVLSNSRKLNVKFITKSYCANHSIYSLEKRINRTRALEEIRRVQER